jgi:hypothetical protein
MVWPARLAAPIKEGNAHGTKLLFEILENIPISGEIKRGAEKGIL